MLVKASVFCCQIAGVTIFGKIFQVFGKLLMAYLVFGKIYNLFSKKIFHWPKFLGFKLSNFVAIWSQSRLFNVSK